MYLGTISYLEKNMLKVCFESPFTRMISSWNTNTSCPPPPGCRTSKQKLGWLGNQMLLLSKQTFYVKQHCNVIRNSCGGDFWHSKEFFWVVLFQYCWGPWKAMKNLIWRGCRVYICPLLFCKVQGWIFKVIAITDLSIILTDFVLWYIRSLWRLIGLNPFQGESLILLSKVDNK